MTASSLINNCRFKPSAGGTTDWTYSAPVTGYQSPAAAGVVNGATYSYRAESADLTQWEIGTGTYNTSTGVLTRGAVLFNSAGTTAKINFSAAPQVAIVSLKEDLAGQLAELGRVVASSSATIDFDFAGGFPGEFDEFEVHLISVTPATNDASLGLRIKTTGSLTVQTSGYAYGGRVQGQTAGADMGSSADSVFDRISLTRPGTGQGATNANGPINGSVRFRNPNAVGTTYTLFDYSIPFYRSDNTVILATGVGVYGSAVAITGLRFLMSSGNIASGTFVLYGRRK